MKRLLHVGLAAAILGGGCGTSKPATGMDMGFGSVNIFSWWTGTGEADALRAVLELYQSTYPGTTVRNSAVTGSGALADQDVAKGIATGMTPPDTFQLSGSGGDVAAWTSFVGTPMNPVSPAKNVLMPLDELYAEQGWLSSMPTIITDALRGKDGHMYMVPVDIHRQNSLFYNKAVFTTCPKVGGGALTAPTTWDEYLNVTVPSLEACNVIPLAISGQGWTQNILWSNVLLGTVGTTYRTKYENGQADLSSTATADATTLRASLHTLYKVLSHVNFSATGALGWDGAAGMLQSTGSDKAAMYIHGDWVKGYYQAKGWHAGIDFAEVPGPGTQGNYLFNFDDFAIPVDAQNPAAAKAFLSVFASKQGQIAFNGYKGSAPVRNDLDVSQFDSVEQQKIAELENPSTNLLPLSANSGDWGNEMGCLIPAFRPMSAPSSNSATAQAAEDAAVDSIFTKMALCYSCDQTGTCSPAQAMCFHMTKTCAP